MRFMLIVYGDPTIEDRPMEEWVEFHNKYGARGVFKIGERLYDVTTATTVRVREDKVNATDGPFAETKEHLGGIYVIECKDLDEAIQIASECPGAKTGSMEIRPVFVVPGE
ncbi:MAG: YciI family protein [Anaerolineae bacterium]